IKAVAVRGSLRVEDADPGGVVAAAMELSVRSFGPATAKDRELGTVANLLTFNRLNALPTRNFHAGPFAGSDVISGESHNAGRCVSRTAWPACPIACEHISARSDGPGVRLEYESFFAFGPLCGISDRDAILAAARMCDRFGMDTISAGATVAFAME